MVSSFLHGWALMIDSEVLHRNHMGTPVAGPVGLCGNTSFPKVNLCLFRAGDACRAYRLSLNGVQGGLGGGHSPLLVSLFACRRTEYGV